ncbi:MAG TPA: HepT-like ribonuclease domain-containing protein [Methylocella sp.]|nr:HepT-like ribonuclease domain-containing protein [Methylocella sp.]
MRLEARKYLYDIQRAASLLARFTAGKTFADYAEDAMLRAAAEREFEIIGEALAKMAQLDAALAARISEHRRIIAFRNILIHGYADVDDRLVWGVIETKLPVLRQEVSSLLEELEGESP